MKYGTQGVIGLKTSGFLTDGLQRLHDSLSKHVQSGAVPGLVALTALPGGTHVEVMGTLHAEGGPPMRRDTIFRLASATKPVTAAAVMVLIEQGRLSLDSRVDTWLPELADRRVLTRIDAPLEDTEPARRPITVRDLLTFTFGFGMVVAPPNAYPIQVAMTELGIGSNGTSPSAVETDEWLRRLGTLPLMHQPGDRWMYNTGSDVLGVLIGRVADKPFGAFLAEHVFGPLGMVDTRFHVPADKIHRFPTSYAHDPETGTLTVWDPAAGGKYSSPPAFEVGGDGLVSTADDLNVFFRMLLNGGTHGAERLLSSSSVELMTSNHLTPAQNADKDQFSEYFGDHGGFGFGMGVRTVKRGPASVGQFGWDGGLGTSAQADPALRFNGVLLTQVAQDSADTPELIRDFWAAAYGAIG